MSHRPPTRVSGALSLAAALLAVPTAGSVRAQVASIDPPRGAVDAFPVPGNPFTDSLTVLVYRPAGYDPAPTYPALFTYVGDLYFRRMNLPRYLDSAITVGLTPMLAVGLPTVDSLEAFRVGSPAAADFQRILAERVLPEIERRYAVSPDRDRRWLLGFSAG
ncbi:MAG TPA: alpha/beta hydrolase-fold protein [Gemmatimonadales bacterium]|nr:alpha/beta hydrolase-fold protein [Gemmatimonadales bacterium]